MSPLLEIEIDDAWEQIPVGQESCLRVIIRRPLDQSGGVELGGIRLGNGSRATLSPGFADRGVALFPGETYAMTTGVRFLQSGPMNLSEFLIQANPIGQSSQDRQLLPLPSHPFRVVPSLAAHVTVSVTRICKYDHGVKVDVAVTNVGDLDWQDFNLTVGPYSAVRSGITHRKVAEFRPGDANAIRFESIIAGEDIVFDLSGTAGGERAEMRVSRSIPESGDDSISDRPFTFLEPRSLTTDRIVITPEAGGAPALATGGVYPVYGGKKRYSVVIEPSNPATDLVTLFEAAGQVEVGPGQRVGSEWRFLITVVENPTLTQTVRMYYDVRIAGRMFRGELHLSIRPTSFKHWTIALTAGAAITLRGTAALAPSLIRSEYALDDLLGELDALMAASSTDLLQMSSIFLVRFALTGFDRFVWRPFAEG